MRKLYLLILSLFMLVTVSVQAQYYYYAKGAKTSDNAYPGANSVNTILSNTTADTLVQQTLPFTFSFHGSNVSAYKVSDNGYITFQKKSNIKSEKVNTRLPAAIAPDSSIFAFWNDLELNSSNSARVINWTTGSVGNRVHIIRWDGVSLKGKAATDSMGFAIVINENGSFDLVYLYGKLPVVAKGTAGYQHRAAGLSAFAIPVSPDFEFPTLDARLNNKTDDVVYSFNSGQAVYDINALQMFPVRRYGSVNVPAKIGIKVRSNGSDSITSADINYRINGQTYTKNLTGLNIKFKDTIIFHPDPWTPKQSGLTNIKVWLSNLNGNADQRPYNDTASYNRQILTYWGPKRILFEEFTNVSSKDAGTQNPGFNVVLDRNLDLISIIKYHTFWPGDDPMNQYNTTDVQKRVTFYTVSTIPHVRVDGKGPAGSSPFGSPANVSDKTVEDAVAVNPGFNIMGNTVNKGGSYDFNVEVTSLISTSNSVLFAAIVEDDINFATAPGINGEKVFHHVMRKLLPDGDGTALGEMTPGQNKNVQFEYLPDNIVKVNNLRFVAWVQDKTTKEVFNSFWTEPNFEKVLVNGIEESQDPAMIRNTIFPNPTSGITNIRFSLEEKANVNIIIMDLLGRTVNTVTSGASYLPGEHNLKFDASVLKKGIYLVNIRVNGQMATRKLVVE